MLVRHYGLLLGVAASISLTLAGCSADRSAQLDPVTGAGPTPTPAQIAAQQGPVDDTEETIFTVLGLGKRASERNVGPQTGNTVSPVLWEAAHDALSFTKFTSEDAMTGLLVTDWYSPPSKPNERLRISVFVLSRALRSDSVSVTVERQERVAGGEWHDATVAREVGTNLENAILQRARQIHAERYRSNM